MEFQYTANMHGDEVVGRELALYLIHYLCSNYDQPRIKKLIDNVDIHILPTMNPDGAISCSHAPLKKTCARAGSFPSLFC